MEAQHEGRAIKVFVSYSREQDEGLWQELKQHLSTLIREQRIDIWDEVGAGQERETEIENQLNSADMILLLVSSSFFYSDDCWNIQKRAMEQHRKTEGRCVVIPVLLRPTSRNRLANREQVDWSDLQLLPRNERPVTMWENQDQALHEVVIGIEQAVKTIQRRLERLKQTGQDLPPLTSQQPSVPIISNGQTPESGHQEIKKAPSSKLILLKTKIISWCPLITGRISARPPRGRIVVAGLAIVIAGLAIVVVFVIVGVLPKGDNICNSPAADVSAIDFSPDGKYLATGSLDTGVRVLDVTTALEQPDGITDQTNPKACQRHTEDLQYTSYTDGVVAVKFSPDGKYLATASLNSAGLWKMNDGSISLIKLLKHLKNAYDSYNHSVVAIDFNQDTTHLVTADSGGMILVWDINKLVRDITNQKNPSPVAQLNNSAYVTAVSFSLDGKYIVISVNKKALLWDWNTHRVDQIATTLQADNVTDVTFSQKKGEYVIAAARADGKIEVFNITGSSKRTPLTSNTYITKLSFSPDGEYIAAISLDQKAQVWSLKAKPEKPLSDWQNSPNNKNITAIAFSKTHYFAIASANRVTLWDTTNWHLKDWSGENLVYVAFDNNEEYLAIASANGKIRIIKI